MITNGEVMPGEFMPTEARLAEQFDVARGTVKAATARLVNEGLIERIPGNRGGMRVRDRVVITHYMSRAEYVHQPHSESDTFFREVRAQGFEPSQQFETRIVALTAELAQRLELDEGQPVAMRRCLRFVNGRPTSLQATYYPKWLTDQVPDLLSPTDIAMGTTALLRQRGFDQVAFKDEINSRMPTPEELAQLELSAGTTVMESVRTGLTMDAPVRVTVDVFAGDTNRLVYTHGSVEALARAEERAG